MNCTRCERLLSKVTPIIKLDHRGRKWCHDCAVGCRYVAQSAADYSAHRAEFEAIGLDEYRTFVFPRSDWEATP